MKSKFLAWAWVTLAATGLSSGQEQTQQVDPPSRVARLNLINGTVSFRPGSQEEWAASTLNYPLTTGDHLWSEKQGGAEMHIGSSALRIAGGTSFAVLNLDDHAIQVSVSQGFLNARVRHLDQGETFEVDTPNGAVSLLSPGDYRIDVNSDSNLTTVSIRSGSAEVNGGGQTFPVSAGQLVRFSGADQLNAEPAQMGTPDPWDQWCANRDQLDERAGQAVAPYVGNNMIGAEDLVGNGEWHNDTTDGAYWVPRVAADWAPYRAGHWAYVEPWGWTWMDDAPWGFAPFHYGRWAQVRGVWGWYPGAVVARPVYAPAMVAFVGGSGFTAAIGTSGPGVAAWVPLGPREVYHPYYRVSEVYVRNVNVTHVSVANIRVTNVSYVNRSYVTAVRQDVFVGAHPCREGFVRVPPAAYTRIERVDRVSYRPAREAYWGRRMEGVRIAAPPRTVVTRTVVVNHAPPVRYGRPVVSSYRAAPAVTRRMEYGQGHYRPVGNTGTVSRPGPPPNYGNRGNTGNVGAGKQYGNRGNPGGQPNYQNQGNPAQGRQFGNRSNTGAQTNQAGVGPHPNVGNRNTSVQQQQQQNLQRQQQIQRENAQRQQHLQQQHQRTPQNQPPQQQRNVQQQTGQPRPHVQQAPQKNTQQPQHPAPAGQRRPEVKRQQ